MRCGAGRVGSRGGRVVLVEGGTRVDTGLLGGVTVAVVEAGVEGAGDGEAAAEDVVDVLAPL